MKGKNLKLKAHCTSLLKERDQRAQEHQQTQKELDRAKQELDFRLQLGGMYVSTPCRLLLGVL